MPRRRPFLHRAIQRNYVGPGNAIDSAEAVDSIDDIAREHDLLYQAIEQSGVNLESVNSADRESGAEFLSAGVNELQSGSVSSGLLGIASGIALTGKAAAEEFVGQPIYPKMAPTKRPHRKKPSTENPLNQTPNKVYRVTGFHKGNLRSAQEKLNRMELNPDKFKDS